MTHLGDSLRNLADRAPLEEATVSVAGAARRVQRGRRLRTAANVTAGVGAAAVVALAAIQPSLPNDRGGSLDAMASFGAGEKADAAADESVAGAYAVPEAYGWGACGSRPLDDAQPLASRGDELSVDSSDAEWITDASVTLPTSLTIAKDGPVDVAPARALVLWNGYVVGSTATEDASFTHHELGEGDIVAGDVGLVLVNCWDTSELPAGDYQMVVYQDILDASVDPVEPSDPATEPVEPAVDPVAPSASASAPSLEPTASVGPEITDGASDAATGASDGSYRSVATIIDFSLDGDVSDDPFGEYLFGTPTAAPEDLLTPAQARIEFARRIAPTAWDMAPGTQRVVKQNDSATITMSSYGDDNYYGCGWDGRPSPTFPAESAVWPLLDVEATLPSRLDLSYGWVVDDNPLIPLSVTNLSGFTLPGFYGASGSSLMLVKDGVVVAESYLTAADPQGVDYSSDGFLAPDGTLSGEYLWRDVSGCWQGNSATKVEPGTYTVLTMQAIYLDNTAYGPVRGLDDVASSSINGEGDPQAAAPVKDSAEGLIAPQPQPADQEWLELQVWTSLAEVTVR